MTAKVVKTRFSLQGWQFTSWLKGNWKTIKEVFKVVAPAIVVWIETQNPTYVLVLTPFAKLALDTLDYYLGQKTDPQ